MTKVNPPVWQASDAQSRLAELVDAAIGGAPQVVRRPDGREVVIMAREAIESDITEAEERPESVTHRMLSRELRLPEDDRFFTYLDEARSHATATFDPSIGGKEFLDAVYPRHQRRKRPDKTST